MADQKRVVTGVFARDFRNHLGVLTLRGHVGSVWDGEKDVLVPKPIVEPIKQVDVFVDKQVKTSRRKAKGK